VTTIFFHSPGDKGVGVVVRDIDGGAEGVGVIEVAANNYSIKL